MAANVKKSASDVSMSTKKSRQWRSSSPVAMKSSGKTRFWGLRAKGAKGCSELTLTGSRLFIAVVKTEGSDFFYGSAPDHSHLGDTWHACIFASIHSCEAWDTLLWRLRESWTRGCPESRTIIIGRTPRLWRYKIKDFVPCPDRTFLGVEGKLGDTNM